jgi:hypothetical protein
MTVSSAPAGGVEWTFTGRTSGDGVSLIFVRALTRAGDGGDITIVGLPPGQDRPRDLMEQLAPRHQS